MHRWLFVCFAVLAVSVVGAAQVARSPLPSALPVYGTVSGHIMCTDTNEPARLASVTLQTIDVRPEPGSGEKQAGKKQPMTVLQTFQTGLDGGFTIPHVRPGTYYVVIQQPGYVSPITQFTRSELEQPTQDLLTRIMKMVPTVTVEANHTTTLDTRIERGAEFSGTIRYDDGTPVAGTYVNALIRETKGATSAWTPREDGGRTDDIGHYRITGLPPGEYVLEVTLQMMEMFTNSVLGGPRSFSSNSKYGLEFYSGDVPRKDKATSMKVQASEPRNADITIPLSKLHPVTGTLTEQRTGHVINSGKVELRYEDGIKLVSTEVDKDDASFHFDFVPEGTYTLAVTEAADVTRQDISNGPGTVPPTHTETKVVKNYSAAQQPLLIENDVSGLVVVVLERDAKPVAVP